MIEIHPTAHLDPEASVGTNVRIGPGAIIGPGVQLGDECEVGSHAILEGITIIGSGCRIFPRAIIGVEPQVVGLKERGGKVEIGPNTVIREMATIHRSMYEDGVTRVGSQCYLMAYSHVAHDCQLGDHVIFTNFINLGGHVEVGSHCFVSNFVGVHQFVRFGEGAIIAGPTAVRMDVPPFTTVEGFPPRVRGLNVVGLRRMDISPEIRADLKRAYRILFQDAKTVAEGIGRIESELTMGREIQSVIEFVQCSKRGFYRGQV